MKCPIVGSSQYNRKKKQIKTEKSKHTCNKVIQERNCAYFSCFYCNNGTIIFSYEDYQNQASEQSGTWIPFRQLPHLHWKGYLFEIWFITNFRRFLRFKNTLSTIIIELYSLDDKPMNTSVFFFFVLGITNLRRRVLLFGIKYIALFGCHLHLQILVSPLGETSNTLDRWRICFKDLIVFHRTRFTYCILLFIFVIFSLQFIVQWNCILEYTDCILPNIGICQDWQREWVRGQGLT